MPLVDYAGRIWKVIHVEGDPPCQVGDDVTFPVKLGESNDVTVSCSREGATTTFNGRYDTGSDTIKVDGYEIRMVLCIKLMTTEGLIAGSWTAEDQGPWPGDG